VSPHRRSLLALVLVVASLALLGLGRPTTTPVAAAAAATSRSWNPHISCTATVTTLATLLGSQRSPAGGPSFDGGGFRPGIPDRRSTTPPCTAGGRPTFVEIHHVVVGSCSKINKDGDWTCEMTDPKRPKNDFNAIHLETGSALRAKGGWSAPPGGTPVDVQGFVFWDPDHVSAAFHHHTGWELHSFTAWRRATS
jgi:hypothetical protein